MTVDGSEGSEGVSDLTIQRLESPDPSITRSFNRLFQHRLMEFEPVVKIIQAHPIFWSGSVIGSAARAQNTARLIIMIISAHRSVVLLDRFTGQRPGVFLYPRFEFGIGRFVLLDVISYRLFFDSD